MFCTDAIFNDERLSDHNLMICTFDGSEATQEGGDVTFTTVKPPYSDTHTYYTYSFETPITFNFQIGKNSCKLDTQEDEYFTQDEQSYLYRWLQRTDGYHWMAFDEEGWEDVWFNTQINLQPVYNNGRVIGYNVTGTTDSPYGYSQLQKKDFKLPVNGTWSVIDYSDKPGIISPKVTITSKGVGNIVIKSGLGEYLKITRLYNVQSGNVITLDKKNDLVDGLTNMNNFNYVFPVIANDYSNNKTTFTNMGTVDCNISMEYRFIRRVNI